MSFFLFLKFLSSLATNAIIFIIGKLITKPVELLVYFNILKAEDADNQENHEDNNTFSPYLEITNLLRLVGYFIMAAAIINCTVAFVGGLLIGT